MSVGFAELPCLHSSWILLWCRILGSQAPQLVSCSCTWFILLALKIAFLGAHHYNSTMDEVLWLKSSLVPFPELGLTGVLFGFYQTDPLQLGAMVYGPVLMLSSTNQASVPLVLTLNMT